MQLDHRYEQQIRSLHDDLYGNANVRTPDGIAGEVAKVLRTLMFEPALDGGVVETRSAFARMNSELRAYPPGTAIELDDRSLAAVRARLAGFDLAGGARDWLGDAIEIFRHLAAKRLGGQFFTHPLVTRLAVTLLEYDPAAGDDLVDVCAGTGGFLLAGASAGGDGPPRVLGLEADAELAALACSNLALRGGTLGEPVIATDSLAPPSEWPAAAGASVGLGRHRCLASNPPFGSRLLVRDQRVLAQFELARRWQRREGGWRAAGEALVPRPPEVLFVERNLQLAQPGRGRVALVTPYQLLSGPQAGFVRAWLLRHARIVAIVDLPPATFQPHTGTKASLLVFERREQPLSRWDACADDPPIFMAVAEHIGHDRRGQPVCAGDGEERVRTDLPEVGRAFAAFRGGGEVSAEFAGAFVQDAAAVASDAELRLNAAFHRPATARLRRRVVALAQEPGWRVVTVGEVARAVFVPGRFKRRYVDDPGGIPLLAGTHIGQFVPANAKRLDPRDPHAARCVVRAGWILITRSGSTGLVSSVAEPWDGWAVSDHVIRVVPDPARLDPGYLEAYLRSEVGQRLLAAGIFGSVIDEITPEHVAQLPVAVPVDPRVLGEIAAQMRRAAAGRSAAHDGIAAARAAIERLTGTSAGSPDPG